MAIHTSMGVSPFLLRFGHSPSLPSFTPQNAFTATSYPDYLTKLAELRDVVDVNLTEAVLFHKRVYEQHSANLPQLFAVNDPVCLSIPTAGKLDHSWEGGWIVKYVKSLENTEITHSYSIRHRQHLNLHSQMTAGIVVHQHNTGHPPQMNTSVFQPPHHKCNITTHIGHNSHLTD